MTCVAKVTTPLTAKRKSERPGRTSCFGSREKGVGVKQLLRVKNLLRKVGWVTGAVSIAVIVPVSGLLALRASAMFDRMLDEAKAVRQREAHAAAIARHRDAQRATESTVTSVIPTGESGAASPAPSVNVKAVTSMAPAIVSHAPWPDFAARSGTGDTARRRLGRIGRRTGCAPCGGNLSAAGIRRLWWPAGAPSPSNSAGGKNSPRRTIS